MLPPGLEPGSGPREGPMLDRYTTGAYYLLSKIKKEKLFINFYKLPLPFKFCKFCSPYALTREQEGLLHRLS